MARLSSILVLSIVTFVYRGCVGLPDMLIDEESTRLSLDIQNRYFDEDSCALLEKCIPGLSSPPRSPLPPLPLSLALFSVRDLSVCSALYSSVFLMCSPICSHVTFSPSEGPGLRTLLRFDSFIGNIGTSNLELGKPSLPRYHFDECHNHWHLPGFALYELLDHRNRSLGLARKQAFCVTNFKLWHGYTRDVAPFVYRDCQNFQGINVGWGDLYAKVS